MILSDKTIISSVMNGPIVIEPFNVENVQPASVDLTLAEEFLIFDQEKTSVIDPMLPVDMRTVKLNREGFLLSPGGFALGSTRELIGIPNGYVGRLEGKSSLARLGLLVHVTAGFIDPGWKPAQITLEFVNLAPVPIILREGMKIAQLSIETVDKQSYKPYGHEDLHSKYVNQRGPTASQYYKN